MSVANDIEETKLGRRGEEFLERQVGTILKSFREEEGLTQKEVAKKLGNDFRQQYVSDVERNRKSLDFVETIKFADLYNVTLDEIRNKLKKTVALQQAILDIRGEE